MCVLEGHIPTIAQLQPGVVVVTDLEGEETKYFVSGGYGRTFLRYRDIVNSAACFLTGCFLLAGFVHPGEVCSVNVVEAIPLEELDASKAQAAVERRRRRRDVDRR